MAHPLTVDPRWTQLVARDESADGHFVYGVLTTGVFCRPSCASRQPSPENVRLYDSVERAQEAGFRPCKRCRPIGPTLAEEHAALVARACRSLESTESLPTLGELAAEAGLSPSYFHRLFKAHTGVSPKAYAALLRRQRVQRELTRQDNVTDAIFAAGYVSSGRFYEQSDSMLGMTPSAWRAGGTGVTVRFAVGTCSLGEILVAHSGRGLCAVLLGEDAETLIQDLQDRFHDATVLGGDADFDGIAAEVIAYVDDPTLGLSLPVDIRGTAFQRRVWTALREIPSGETRSYADVARAIGKPKAHRAVASACGANPVAVVVPCHRVMRSDGGLGGYRWGLATKRTLLAREDV